MVPQPPVEAHTVMVEVPVVMPLSVSTVPEMEAPMELGLVLAEM